MKPVCMGFLGRIKDPLNKRRKENKKRGNQKKVKPTEKKNTPDLVAYHHIQNLGGLLSR